MPLTPCTDVSAAAWLTSSDQPWQQLATLGPSGFASYARLRFLPDPAHPGQEESDVEVDPGAPSEHELLRTALEVLGHHTRTPDDCYFCLWDGWGQGLSRPVLAGPKVVLPGRGYHLFRGALSDLGDWGPADLSRGPSRQTDPAFVWPADHAWCLADDVDPHYAGIGAAAAAIDELLAHPGLDVVPADPRREQPHYG